MFLDNPFHHCRYLILYADTFVVGYKYSLYFVYIDFENESMHLLRYLLCMNNVLKKKQASGVLDLNK
jgi:hypothetical protein